MEFGLLDWSVLLLGAAAAGWVDAVIGGGGLVLIPLILAVAPQLAPATALATNKLAAVFGTASAAFTMVRQVRPSRRVLAAYLPVALGCAGSGALAASLIQASVMRPVIIVLLLAVGTFVALRPGFGAGPEVAVPSGWRRWAALAGVAVIGFYDGLFGPGTGMFLIMAFTGLLSQNFLTSAAMAKVVNTATNLGALLVFALGGHVLWLLGLSLAVANVLGAQMGAKTVLGGGITFIRGALITTVVIMSGYLLYQQFSGL